MTSRLFVLCSNDGSRSRIYLTPRRGKPRIGLLRTSLKTGTPYSAERFYCSRKNTHVSWVSEASRVFTRFQRQDSSAPPQNDSHGAASKAERNRLRALGSVVQFAFIFFLFLFASVQAADVPKEKITFAYASISPSMSAVWMAKELGAFDRNGLNAELVYISSGATTIQALVGGSVQAALGASNAVVAAALKGAPIIAVASNTSRPGMQLWVQPEIQRAEQLQGKTLAITRFGSTSDFVTRLVLRKLNLENKTELRQFGGVVEADLGFRARQAEGRVSSQAPGPKAKMLVDAAELGIPFSMNLLAVSNEYLSKSPKSVEAIVRGYIEGVAALKTRSEEHT